MIGSRKRRRLHQPGRFVRRRRYLEPDHRSERHPDTDGSDLHRQWHGPLDGTAAGNVTQSYFDQAMLVSPSTPSTCILAESAYTSRPTSATYGASCRPPAVFILVSTRWSLARRALPLPSCPPGEMASWTNCQGSSAYPNGGTYVGEFRDGKPNGVGTLTYRHYGEYVGEFRDSWPSGRGTYTYPDGRRYVGEWRNGDFNGRGIRTYPDGRKEDGEWSGGKLIRSAEENLPLSDTSKKPQAANVDASEINQSRPFPLI